jgi:hypothetical protein
VAAVVVASQNSCTAADAAHITIHSLVEDDAAEVICDSAGR